MEKIYFNLSAEEFSKSRKVLLWIFSGLFFIAGIWVMLLHFVFGHKETIPLVLSAAPFGISIVTGIIATLSSLKGKEQYFSIDNDKLEFSFGILSPRHHSFNWSDIQEVVMPNKQKKAMLHFKNETSFLINLTWLQKTKAALIRKHIYQTASEKQLKVSRVQYLKKG